MLVVHLDMHSPRIRYTLALLCEALPFGQLIPNVYDSGVIEHVRRRFQPFGVLQQNQVRFRMPFEIGRPQRPPGLPLSGWTAHTDCQNSLLLHAIPSANRTAAIFTAQSPLSVLFHLISRWLLPCPLYAVFLPMCSLKVCSAKLFTRSG